MRRGAWALGGLCPLHMMGTHVVGAQASVWRAGLNGRVRPAGREAAGPSWEGLPLCPAQASPLCSGRPCRQAPAHFPPAGSFPWSLGPALSTSAHRGGIPGQPRAALPYPPLGCSPDPLLLHCGVPTPGPASCL